MKSPGVQCRCKRTPFEYSTKSRFEIILPCPNFLVVLQALTGRVARVNNTRKVAAVLVAEGLKGCTVIGHSMGGTVGAYLAIQHPSLVSKLIIAEGNLEAGGGPGTRRIANYDETEWLNSIFDNQVEAMR